MNKEQLALREQALLSAALNCLATERCEDVTVARIAKLAGVAKGTVYLHFASKDEICARLAQDFYNPLGQKYSNISGNGVTRLDKIIKTSFNHYLREDHYRHIVQYCHREHFLQSIGAEISQSLQSIGLIRRQHIAKALEYGTNDRTLSRDAESKLTGICCVLDGALHKLDVRPQDEPSLPYNRQQEFIDTVTRYILSSVGHNTTAQSTQPSSELTLEV